MASNQGQGQANRRPGQGQGQAGFNQGQPGFNQGQPGFGDQGLNMSGGGGQGQGQQVRVRGSEGVGVFGGNKEQQQPGYRGLGEDIDAGIAGTGGAWGTTGAEVGPDDDDIFGGQAGGDNAGRTRGGARNFIP